MFWTGRCGIADDSHSASVRDAQDVTETDGRVYRCCPDIADGAGGGLGRWGRVGRLHRGQDCPLVGHGGHGDAGIGMIGAETPRRSCARRYVGRENECTGLGGEDLVLACKEGKRA